MNEIETTSAEYVKPNFYSNKLNRDRDTRYCKPFTVDSNDEEIYGVSRY